MLFFQTIIGSFVVFYPVFMSLFWMIGSLYHRQSLKLKALPKINSYPKVSILLPCFNEEKTIENTVISLLGLDYPDYEIIMINDKSTDNTLEKMQEIVNKYHDSDLAIKILDMPQNGGKARGLNAAVKQIQTDYIMVVDSDCYVARNSLMKLMDKLLSDSKYGAVTGAPVIQNRTTLLGKLQTLEYIGIIGNIKRAQAFFFNRIMTISGVLVCYRVSALETINYFDPSAMTEDIDATWRLYKNKLLVGYQPEARCYILAPESVKGLFKQRTRWSVGGMEVLFKNIRHFFELEVPERLLLMEMIFSNMWAISMMISMILYIINYLTMNHLTMHGGIMFFSLIIGIVQFSIGYIGEKEQADIKFEDRLLVPVYLLIYWLMNLCTALSAMWKFATGQSGDGKWSSSDRGL